LKAVQAPPKEAQEHRGLTPIQRVEGTHEALLEPHNRQSDACTWGPAAWAVLMRVETGPCLIEHRDIGSASISKSPMVEGKVSTEREPAAARESAEGVHLPATPVGDNIAASRVPVQERNAAQSEGQMHQTNAI